MNCMLCIVGCIFNHCQNLPSWYFINIERCIENQLYILVWLVIFHLFSKGVNGKVQFYTDWNKILQIPTFSYSKSILNFYPNFLQLPLCFLCRSHMQSKLLQPLWLCLCATAAEQVCVLIFNNQYFLPLPSFLLSLIWLQDRSKTAVQCSQQPSLYFQHSNNSFFYLCGKICTLNS